MQEDSNRVHKKYCRLIVLYFLISLSLNYLNILLRNLKLIFLLLLIYVFIVSVGLYCIFSSILIRKKLVSLTKNLFNEPSGFSKGNKLASAEYPVGCVMINLSFA